MKSVSVKTLIVFIAASLALLSCDFLSETGSMGGMARVMIPLDFGDSGSRAVGSLPLGTQVTGSTVSVFGPGMQPIRKYVSRGAKYIEFDIPAGRDRCIRLEVHFTITNSSPVTGFPYTHVRSFIGEATKDLRPGVTVGLSMNMHAGATQLLAPDNSLFRVWNTDSLSGFGAGTYGQLGQGASLLPNDLDVASDGSLICVNGSAALGMVWSQATTPVVGASPSFGTLYAGYSLNTLAVDRHRDFMYTSRFYSPPPSSGGGSPALYLYKYAYDSTAHTISTPSGMEIPNLNLTLPVTGLYVYSIAGIAVDPFTGYLYLTAYITDSMTSPTVAYPSVVEYDPSYISGATFGRVIRYTTRADFFSLSDVIVKDNAVFALNIVRNVDTTLPILLKFDRDLNYLGGYGTLSVSGGVIQPSTAPGKFYHPRRFIAHENEGLYIIDDSASYDKIVYIDTDLNPSSWKTFPDTGAGSEPFTFSE